MQDNGAHPTIPTRDFTSTQLANMSLRKTLNDVKQMYFGHRYRQCISRCAELLESELQDFHQLIIAYLYFYTALSYDTLARGMHSSSMSRIPTLHDAEHYFQKALLALPNPLPVITPNPKDSAVVVRINDPPKRQRSSHLALELSVGNHHRSPGLVSVTNISANPLSALSETPSKLLIFEPRPDNKWSLLPPVNKATNSELFPTFDLFIAEPPTVPCVPTSLGFTAANKLQRNDSTASVLSVSSHQIRRYNEDLAAFTSMLQNHISSVQALKNAYSLPKTSLNASDPSATSNRVDTDQEKRHGVSLRSDTGKSGRFLNDAEKAIRIMRGRERGWARDKFNGKRYEKLREAALAEL
ncbi:uncharacterized protein K452DRAFT_337002 [Aplosporella prunicola CBS 121167]|uniref:Uncharacterized protein n=1 Tax=Aplosporella prunicola CBS 121167 TaxID=1176127 RepID=A0A6A6BRN6_9PEZI|nr:uncharacterized protein K452DRAFT_337002 [Aplosporella prunicola CBS 121167]KAF2146756.1 hypothetical protein K452DRAFT_337002 [Aplosporella prunicola CBS 121167]